MGSGSFDSIGYSARAAARAASGASVFTHDAAVAAGKAPAIHDAMDVRKKRLREARDGADSPFSFPIAVMFDVTGSMRDVPNYLQTELGKLMGFVLGEGVVEFPQILFGAIGDAYCDSAPLQMGEFEADDALVEKTLSQIYLEGGGGGTSEESYELAMYFFARHIKTDAWEKRGTKGVLFLIGDENFYPEVNARLRWSAGRARNSTRTFRRARSRRSCSPSGTSFSCGPAGRTTSKTRTSRRRGGACCRRRT